MKSYWLMLGVMNFFFATMIFMAASNDEVTALLFDAVIQDNLEKVKVVINAGADVNAIYKSNDCDNGFSALHFAAGRDCGPMVSELLNQKDINVNVIIEPSSEVKGFTPLHLAAFKDCGQAVEELCKHPDIQVNAVVRSCGKYKGYTPLHLASVRGYASAVKALIKHKDIDINGAIECDGKYKGFTPLHLAIFKGYRFAVIELLQHKDIAVCATIKNDGEYDGFTPLRLAVSRGYLKIAEELLKNKGILQVDSYPDGLGKEVVFLIQNNLECLEEVFDKIIFVKNIDNLDESEANFILIEPEALVNKDIKDVRAK